MIGGIRRPTAAGAILLAGGVGLAALGVAAADNVLVLLGAILAGPLVADAILGRTALRDTTVRRVLPDELYADQPGSGAVVVSTGAAAAVVVYDPRADVVVEARGPGFVSLPVHWRFASRGEVTLGPMALRTTWPLGVFLRERIVDRPVTLVVAPRPRSADSTDVALDGGSETEGDARSRLGDPRSLRVMGAGDRARDVHWPTSARRGEPFVVERAGDVGQTRVVAVRAGLDGDAFERELGRACGLVLDALQHGPVTLQMGGARYGPGSGATFRRELLDRLATAAPGVAR